MDESIDPALAVEQRALRLLKPMNAVIDRGDSPVQKFYEGAVLFMTGGSGFLGKQLIEKIFRACNISKLYLLLRPKKGKSVNERLQEILEDPVFDTVRHKKPGFEKKIVPLLGDVAAVRLGISDDHWNMLSKEVDVIFHVAATTRFDEKLPVATLINVRGTKETLTLASTCTKLRSFVHVSTAYTNAKTETLDEVIEEKFYPTPIPPDTLISLVENVEPQRLAEVEKSFIQGYPNMYTFAKSVAEAEVRKWSGKFPICIVRPGIVISSYREPSPGWTDMSTAYSASGLVLAPALGLMHVMYARDDIEFNMIPVDYVNNAIIVAAYETAKNRSTDEPKIYTVASANNVLSWNTLTSNLARIAIELPTPFAVWYIFVLVVSSKYMFLILSTIFHFIPGYIADGISLLLRKKPRFTRLTKKMYKISSALAYFTTHSWTFGETNTEKLFKSLTESDKAIFNFDAKDIDHDEYVSVWVVGLRRFIFKDGLKDTKYAQKKQFWLKILHTFVCMIYFYALWRLVLLVFYVLVSVFSLFF